jgi:type II secretory pathway predicted ATPase ExeA
MAYLVERGRPLAYLTGTAGVGKSTALSLLADEVRSPGRRVVKLSTAGMSDRTLLLALAAELGLGRSSQSMPDRQSLLLDYLVGMSATRESAVILLDDFDMADESCLALMSSMLHRLAPTEAKVSLIATVTENGSRTWHDAGRTWADLVVRLAPWTLHETAKYVLGVVERRNRQSHAAVCLIEDSGLRALHDSSGGIPGRLERILELSQLACESLEESQLTAEIVRAASQELFPRHTSHSRMSQLRPVEA